MPQYEERWSGWQGVCLIAITYVYFLIFAQFAFLKRLAILGIADAHLKAVMGAMAVGGIVLSLLAPRLALRPSPRVRLQIALAMCALAALLSLGQLSFVSSMTVSLMIGSGLGLLTVTLVTHLSLWLGNRNPLLKVGVGTGAGYLICNLPTFFATSPQFQAITCAIICLTGIFVALKEVAPPTEKSVSAAKSTASFFRVLICFTALVWFDSAAFFIIQNNPALKAGTWQGSTHLWTNGLLHLIAALVCVWLLRRLGLSSVLSFAFLALASACLLLLDPSSVIFASVFYPVGVSLYSVALVAYPSLLAPASSIVERGRQAGWIYAIAGWFGSAMGIGMGQHLGHVPPAFVLLAGVLVLAPGVLTLLRQRRLEFMATGAFLAAAFCVEKGIVAVHPSRPQLSQTERGRQIYISEGCINCHSQYVRPNTPDVLMWGPVQPLEELRQEHPPLIGNRRQGPDLAEVGSRRSPLWLKAHFYNPSQFSPGSFMPSYAYLFRDHRGDDLVSYLQGLRDTDIEQHLTDERAWQPSPGAYAEASTGNGQRLFYQYCATCHDAHGSARTEWRTSFKRLPPDLSGLHPRFTGSNMQTIGHLARIARFGIPGTDMPGHEYLSDKDIASLSLWLAQTIPQPMRNQASTAITDEKQ